MEPCWPRRRTGTRRARFDSFPWFRKFSSSTKSFRSISKWRRFRVSFCNRPRCRQRKVCKVYYIEVVSSGQSFWSGNVHLNSDGGRITYWFDLLPLRDAAFISFSKQPSLTPVRTGDERSMCEVSLAQLRAWSLLEAHWYYRDWPVRGLSIWAFLIFSTYLWWLLFEVPSCDNYGVTKKSIAFLRNHTIYVHPKSCTTSVCERRFVDQI